MIFKRLIVAICGLGIFFSKFCFGEEPYVLEEVKVVAPAKGEFLEKIGQEVKIINFEQFKELGFEVYSGFELRERGAFGVQSDLSIRGSNFEQNLVVLEGIRISDPQTGHHLMNLPFESHILESLEILPGGASAIYGPGGFGGALNFNLKSSQPGIKISGDYGSYDYQNLYFNFGLSTPFSPVNIIFSQKNSNGFIWNRDFDIRTFNFYTKDKGKILFYGFQEKDFGARNFYTLRWNTEWETTKTHIFLVKKVFYGLNWFFEPGILYRINYDTYILNRRNPSFYKNIHKSQVFRTNLPFRIETNRMDYLMGMEYSYETLDSSRLGDHLRIGEAFYFWFYPKINLRVFPAFGIRYDIFTKGKENFSYNVALAYLLKENLKIRTSFSYSYRNPSFTELYYLSPSVQGNPFLLPEKSYNFEVGCDYYKKNFNLFTTIFYRIGEDIIDWIWRDQIRRAENIEKLKTVGFTIDLTYKSKFFSPVFSYTYLNQISQELGNAHYVGSYLRHNLILGFIFKLPYDVEVSSKLNYQKRYKEEDVYLVSGKISKKLLKNVSVGIWFENLLNEKYEEIRGIQGIPQWIGINIILDK